MTKQPTDAELFQIYLKLGYDEFCEFGGLSNEGKKLALHYWNKTSEEKYKDATQGE